MLKSFFKAVAWFGAAFITSATLPGIGLLKLPGFIAANITIVSVSSFVFT